MRITSRSHSRAHTKAYGTTLSRETAASKSVEQVQHGESLLTICSQADAVYSGISTFGRLPYRPCLSDENINYDLAFIGIHTHSTILNQWLIIPRRTLRHRHFVQTWRSFRTLRNQARFSPSQPVVCIMKLMYHLFDQGSRKVRFSGGYNVPLDANPFNDWAKVIDCGDIPVTS